MYHLVNRLELNLRCKNYRDGCVFTQPLIQKMDQSNYTLIQTHTLMRNHELECRICPDCSIKCKDCKQHLN